MDLFGTRSLLAQAAFVILILTSPVIADPKDDSTKAYIGITVRDLSSRDMAPGVPDSGALVTWIDLDGPAEDAGIEIGDVVTKAGNQDIHNAADLKKAVTNLHVNTPLSLLITRDGETKSIAVTVGIRNLPEQGDSDRSRLVGQASERGLAKFSFQLNSPGVVRLLALPLSEKCEEISYSLKADASIIETGTFYPGTGGLTHLSGNGLRGLELFAPPGPYEIQTVSTQDCQYAVTLITRPLPDFKRTLSYEIQSPLMNLSREAELKQAIISSGLFQFIDVGSVQMIFVDKLGSGKRRLALMEKACAVGPGYSSGDDDVMYIVSNHLGLALEYANYSARDLSNKNVMKSTSDASGKLSGSYQIWLPGYDKQQTCDNKAEINNALGSENKRLYVSFSMKNVDHTVTEQNVSHQLVIAKFELLLRRLFGTDENEVILHFTSGFCESYSSNGIYSRGYCMNSGYAGAPIRFNNSTIEGVQDKVSASPFAKDSVESALRKIVGADAKIEFPVNSDGLIQARISHARQVIIKSQNYWELIYLDIIPTPNHIGAVIEAFYSPGLGSDPPSDESFKGNTERDFPSETANLLNAIVNGLAELPSQK